MVGGTPGRLFRALQAWSARNRRIILPVAVIVFVAALVWAVRDAGIRPASLDPTLLLFNALVLTPLTIVLNAAGLMISAWALGLRVSPGTAVRAFAAGVVADLTPVPGSLAAHAGTLLGAGAKPLQTGGLMAGRLVVMLGFALVLAAASLHLRPGVPVAALAWVGAAISAAGFGALAVGCGLKGALAIALHRAATVVWISVRIWVSFASVGLSLALIDAPVLAAAGIVGSAGFIAPGGLGVSEALGALAAPLIDASPTGTFSAMALNRILMFVLCGVIVIFALKGREAVSK